MFEDIKEFLGTDTGKAIGGIGGALLGYFGGQGGGQSQGSQGYAGGIPELTAQRSLVPDAFNSEGRRPGEGGRRYFTSQAASDLYKSPGTNQEGLPMLMGQGQLDYLAGQNQLADLQRTGQGLGLLSLLTGVDIDQLPDYFKNRATGNTIDNGAIQNEVMGSANTPITRTQEEAPEELKGGAVGDTVYEPAYNTIKQFLGNIRDKYGNLTSKEAQEEVVSFMRRYQITPKTMSLVTGKPEEEILNTLYSSFAGGGLTSLGKGYYLGGSTDGMADEVPATIDGAEPARLSDGEFVVPADVVSHLGNGNSDAGAKQLYSMMDRVRKARTGTTKQGTEINPRNYLV